MQIPKSRHEKLQIRDESPIYLTPEGIQRLKDKLVRLKASIPNLAGDAKRAADYGDRSENAEYKDAKGKLRGTHREILRVTDQLKRAVSIKPNATGKVQIGSTVVIQIVVPAGAPPASSQVFQIVGPEETDPSNGRISYKSPLGSVLMNHIVGETTIVKTASGLIKYLILEVG